jgi:3-hydroxyisobutyryl-CoA hydrolase
VITGNAPSSGAFKVTEKELMERIMDARGEIAGGREREVRSWVKQIVGRNCEVKDGYLDWKGRD